MYKWYIILYTFNNRITACFFNKKYPITTKTRPAQIVNSVLLIKNSFNTIFKIIGVQNQFPITFGTDLIGI